MESSNTPPSRVYSSPMKLFVVALLSSLKNLDNSTSKLVFRPLMHQPRIYSGAPPGIHVTTVHAYNPEKPRNKVEYNMPNILDHAMFSIDQTSGNLTTSMLVSGTPGQTLQIMVAAVSHGSSELEHLQIAITEFNQYVPRFEKRNYQLEFHFMTPVNTTVLQVKATDPDPAPYNAEIYYKMDQNQTSKYFALDALSGDLVLIHPINISHKNLHFGIFAEDGGSPKRWDYVPVNIMIKTISDPLGVTVMNVSHDTAAVCWEEPLYGDISGFGIIIESTQTDTSRIVNVHADNDLTICETISSLEEDTEYKVLVFGWNEEEKGQLSETVNFQTISNWCKSSPCNSGICEPWFKEPWYTCHCLLGYSGSHCEYLNPCLSNPCGTNGKCLNTSVNQYLCICNDDYSGPNCDFYNPCLKKNPCENGGICEMTSENTFACICPQSFYGYKCRQKNLCLSNPCANGGTCKQVSDDAFQCHCLPGYTGFSCDSEINACVSMPCSKGATCVHSHGSYSCLCPPGYTGVVCNEKWQCSPDNTDTDRGMFYWNATNHSTVTAIKCPFGPLDTVSDGFAERRCALVNGSATWELVNATKCKAKNFADTDELAAELQNITRIPSVINSETLETAVQGIETIAIYAKADRKLAQNMVDVISNMMDVNNTVFEQDESGNLSHSLLQSIEALASNIELIPGESMSISSANLRIESVEWIPTTPVGSSKLHKGVEFSAPADNEHIEEQTTSSDEISTTIPTLDNSSTEDSMHPTVKDRKPVLQVFVPKEALQEAHRILEKSVRVKFVVFYNDKFFQAQQTSVKNSVQHSNTPAEKSTISKESESTELNSVLEEIRAPILQISVGDVSFANLDQPLIYILPMKTKRKASCVFWNEKAKRWSVKGLKTNQTFDKVICESSHMTAFSILLDLTPHAKVDETSDTVLSYISYAGSVLSVVGLILTILTYLLFRCLNRDHPGKILLNLCFSLLMMNVAFLLGSTNITKSVNACAAVALFIHYFVLTSLSWMCVEAINMYQLLVYVFASSETHFLFKRCLFAWGGPLIIVASTAIFGLEAYYDGIKFCILTPRNPWIYYGAFLAPSCLILLINFIVFVLVSRVIFTPRLTARTNLNHNPKVTVSQVRGAFTVMVLLGVTWVFGTMAVGTVKIVFQYVFCIANSLQGFLIFLVRCLMYHEARKAWVYLLKSGKLKKHRGGFPPGTVSFSSNSGGKHGQSPNLAVKTECNDDSGISFDRNCLPGLHG